MSAFKRNSEGLNLLISKGVVVECMTLFTKMSLKGYEDNDLAPKVNDHYLHVFANVRWLNIITKNELAYSHKR